MQPDDDGKIEWNKAKQAFTINYTMDDGKKAWRAVPTVPQHAGWDSSTFTESWNDTYKRARSMWNQWDKGDDARLS